MPFNTDGSYTSPNSGRTYPKGITRDQLDFVDRDAFDQESADSAADHARGLPASGSQVLGGIDAIGGALGLVPSTIDASAPGATFQTGAADAQRARTQPIITALQQQATTGSGAWEKTFTDAIRRTKDAALAVGSSSPGTDYGSSLRNINAAQTSADQYAEADKDILRNQSMLDARSQLGGILGDQAQADLGEATEAARVERARRAANQTLIDQSLENRKSTEKSISGAFGMMGGMSDGGQVPGQPKVFGDDSRNDTVPAWLTPKEIVLPLSVTQSPDAPERAAEFVRAVKGGHKQGDGQHFADGGETGIRPVTHEEGGGEGIFALNFLLPHIGRAAEYENLRKSVGSGGGGQIDTGQFRQTTNQQDAIAALFSGQAAGTGPTVTEAMLQRAIDADIVHARQAQAVGANQRATLQSASEEGVGSGSNAARQKAIEQSQEQDALSKILAQRRAQELQLASAQQQAAWEKTLADAGVSLKNQAALRGVVGAAGQGAAAFAAGNKGEYTSDPDNLALLSRNPYPDAGGRGPEEWNSFDDEGPGGGLKGGMAYGGAVGMAGGGGVEGHYPAMPKPQDRSRHTDVKIVNPDVETNLQRKVREWDEEDSGMYHKHAKAEPERESALARALKGAGKYAQQAVGALKFADGGSVPFNPYLFDVQRGGGPMLVDPNGNLLLSQPLPQQPAGPSFLERINPMNAYRNIRNASIAEESKANAEAARKEASPAPARDIATGPQTMVASAPGMMGGPPPASVVVAQEAMAKTPGLLTREEYDALQPKTGETPPAVKSSTSGAGVGRPSGSAADEASRAAAREQYTADTSKANAEAANAAAMANAIETRVNERKALAAKVQERTSEAKARYDAAQQEMARIDTTVDPGRFWATRSTGDKVLGIMGLVLGALGAGPDGVNRAALMLNQAIDRDLDAQRAQHELRLKKGAARIDAARSYYSMARDAGGDELSAMDLAHAAALNGVVAKGQQLIAKTGDIAAKARLGSLLASVEQGAAQRSISGWEKAQERALEREKIDAMRGQKSGDAAAIKDARDAAKTYVTMKATVDELKGLIGGTNIVTEKVGSKAARMDTLAGDLLLQVKEAERLGALDKGSIAVAEQIIGDPTATFTLDSTKIAKLNTLLEQAHRRAAAAGAAVTP